MIRNLKTAMTGALGLAIASGMLLAGAGAAHAAAGDPTFETPTGNPGTVGSVGFYDAAGHPIYSGNVSDDPIAAYFVASGGGIKAADSIATAYTYTPQDNKPADQWTTPFQLTGGDTFGAAASTGYPGDLHNSTKAIAIGFPAGSFASVNDATAAFPLASTNDPGILQVRILTGQDASKYYSTDIKITGTTWTQVFPAPPVAAKSTVTTLSASPDPSVVGGTVTLTATETASDSTHPAGSVQFTDGSTNIGSPVAVSAGGVASTTTSSLTLGAHGLTSVFTPTAAGYTGSTGTFSATVNPASTATTTALAVVGNTAGADTTLTATVAPSAAPGTVAFYDNGSPTAIAGTVTSPSAGTYVLDLPTGLTAGAHSIVAKFTPTNVANFQASQSAPQAVNVQAAAGSPCADPNSVCTDAQTITATIPVGTLVINTPYTPASPLSLGTLTLKADSTQFNGSATFDNIKVTDTRSGNLPWTVSALASALSDGGSHVNSVINAQNLGLTTISATPGTGFTGTITPTDNTAANAVAPGDTGSLGLGGTVAHTVAVANHGLGTVTMKGTLTLNAPSSTEPGLFTGTITFTVG
jgi:hypothetical protein